jgi:hypothetical protein
VQFADRLSWFSAANPQDNVAQDCPRLQAYFEANNERTFDRELPCPISALESVQSYSDFAELLVCEGALIAPQLLSPAVALTLNESRT